jgi:hypothetical protein
MLSRLLARVEEEFQISNWCLVEGQDDYDRSNCTVQRMWLSCCRIV